MEKVTRKTSPSVPEIVLERSFDKEKYPDIEIDENGRPVGCCTVVEMFDGLDRKFVDFYGEEGRRMVNVRREEWNRTGPWHFDLF